MGRFVTKKFKIVLAVSAILLVTVSLSGCGVDNIDISGYADSEIVLSGIDSDAADENGEIIITIADMKEMECVTKKTHSTSDKIGEVRATGPLLDTVLAPYGVSQADYSKIIFYGEDQYDIRLTQDYLKEHDIILAIGIDGEPLDEESAPCRVIIEESDSAYWVRMVDRIEFK